MPAIRLLQTGPLLTAGLIVLASSLAYFFTKLYHARMLLRDRQKQGLVEKLSLSIIILANNLQPVAPGHSFLFGHLLYLKELNDALPKGAHYQYMFADIARKHFVKEGLFYIDLWPMSGLFMIVVSPTAATQATQTNANLSMERPALLPRFFKPIAGGLNLFDLPEKDWKPWRAIFNKGFNTDHVMSLVPGIVKETIIYSETLRDLLEKAISSAWTP
jgi:hypothetical protein